MQNFYNWHTIKDIINFALSLPNFQEKVRSEKKKSISYCCQCGLLVCVENEELMNIASQIFK